ncbi:MAG: hypothetical protein C4523_06895 [Myxococcales bacterium]|nr:MAG: hypothetical protein C4523_06895 [Myxococcales bacterium]
MSKKNQTARAVATVFFLLLALWLTAGCADTGSGGPGGGDADGPADGDAADGEADGDNDGDADEAEPEQVPHFIWPRCDGIHAEPTLAEKAAAFDRLARERHIAPDGLLRNVYLTEDLGEVDHWLHAPNTILWSGIYLASQALRYAVTGDPEAQENARRIVGGLRDLTAVTGRSGLYGRSMIRPGVPYNPVPADAPTWADSEAPGYEGWRFNFDVSQDGYAGLMFGYSAALRHFDDAALLADVRGRVREVVDHLISNGLQIIDITGEVTEHGRVFHSALDNFPGFNAMLASSWVKVGQSVLDDPRLDDFYYGCLMRMREDVECPDFEDEFAVDAFHLTSYIASMEERLYLFIPNCQYNIDNFDMCYQAMYPLATREEDPELAGRLRGVLAANMYHNAEPNHIDIPTVGNTFFTFAYAALTGRGPDEDAVLKDGVERAVCTLKEFPARKFRRHIPAGRQESVCTNRMGRHNAAEPIPLSEYDFDNYLWRLDFYEINPEEVLEDQRLVYSPEDYLMAYWMGRHHGLLTEDM